jgi:hypothetical protein
LAAAVDETEGERRGPVAETVARVISQAGSSGFSS